MRLRPTARGLGLAVAGVGVVLAGVGLGAVDLVRIGTVPLVLVAGGLLAVGLRDPGRGRHRLVVERSASPNPVHAGSVSQVTVDVRATDGSGRSQIAGLRLGEQASAELSGGQPLRARVKRSSGRVTLTYPVLAARRGRWSLGPLVVTRTDPFGVARASAFLGGRAEVAVWPTIVELPVPSGVLVGEPDRVALGARTPSTDDASLRDYRFGDDLRRVHWASSARRGELVVRSDERAGLRPVTVLLDLPARPAALEWSISVAASMTLAMLDAGHPARLLVGDKLADGARADLDGLGRREALRHAHTRGGATARAELLNRTIDLDVPESPAAAEEQLLTAAHLVATSESGGEIVLAVLGPLTARTRAALAHVADTAQGWALVRSSDTPSGRRDADSTVEALQHAGWRACIVDPGEDIAGCWLRLLGTLR